MMAWDITALGLPAADWPYVQGTFRQHLEIPGVWLERSTLNAEDPRPLDSPLGLAGQLCMATLVFAAGSAMARCAHRAGFGLRTRIAGSF